MKNSAICYNDRMYIIQDEEPKEIGDLVILGDGHITRIENTKQLEILKKDKAKLLYPEKYNSKDLQEYKEELRKIRAKINRILNNYSVHSNNEWCLRQINHDLSDVIFNIGALQDYSIRKDSDNSTEILS